MKELTKEKREFLEEALIKWRKELSKGRWRLTKSYIKEGVKHTLHLRHSRVIVQLALNKELEIWEHVHHINNNRSDDSLENLQVMTDAEHISLTHAGRRRTKKVDKMVDKEVDNAGK